MLDCEKQDCHIDGVEEFRQEYLQKKGLEAMAEAYEQTKEELGEISEKSA